MIETCTEINMFIVEHHYYRKGSFDIKIFSFFLFIISFLLFPNPHHHGFPSPPPFSSTMSFFLRHYLLDNGDKVKACRKNLTLLRR